MRRTFTMAAITAATLPAAIAPSSAAAQIVELGDQTTPLTAPTCPPGVSPSQCTIVLTRVTALQGLTDGVSSPTKVRKAGRIVAFSVGLSSLSTSTSARKRDIDFLNQTYGGDAQVQLTVLKRVGKHGHRYQVMAASPIYHVVQYLGSVAEFPLLSSIEVNRGETIALTTPTWAPVLSIDLSKKKFAYRQARARHASCKRPPFSDHAEAMGDVSWYPCKYAGTRVEYAATEVTYPLASNAVH